MKYLEIKPWEDGGKVGCGVMREGGGNRTTNREWSGEGRRLEKGKGGSYSQASSAHQPTNNRVRINKEWEISGVLGWRPSQKAYNIFVCPLVPRPSLRHKYRFIAQCGQSSPASACSSLVPIPLLQEAEHLPRLDAD